MSEVAARTADFGTVRESDALLDAARLSAARRQVRWSRRPLSPGIRVLLWALRIYVLLMLIVVGIQLARLG